MLFCDHAKELHNYDPFCHECYCQLKQNNVALYHALYENWYITNTFYPIFYGWNRNINVSSEFSKSVRSSSPITQSNEERNKNKKYSTWTEKKEKREIDSYNDAYFYGFYDAVRRLNPMMYSIIYANWCASHHLPASEVHGNQISQSKAAGESSHFDRSSSPTTQSNEERDKSKEFPTSTGNKENPEIDFHYRDGYFCGFYDAMRRINPMMYAVLYANWCAADRLLVNEVDRSQIPQSKAAGESSHFFRDRLRNDIMNHHYFRDGRKTLTSDYSASPVAKRKPASFSHQFEDLGKSDFQMAEHMMTKREHRGSETYSPAERQLNCDVAGEIMLPSLFKPGNLSPLQEIKKTEPTQETKATASVHKAKVSSSELQSPCTTTDTRTRKPLDLSEKKQEKSWINSCTFVRKPASFSHQFEGLDKSNFQKAEHTMTRREHCGSETCSTAERQLNCDVAGEIMLPNLYKPGNPSSLQEIKKTEPTQETKATESVEKAKVSPSELQSSCTTTDKRTRKPLDLSENKQGKSWLKALLTKLHFSSGKEAHLPDDDCPTIIWNSDRNQWTDMTTYENDDPGTLPLPPKLFEVAPSGANNVYRLKKSRDVRSKYVDVLQYGK